jgi:hypothetical protein
LALLLVAPLHISCFVKKIESDVETEIREVRAAYKKAQANDSNSDKDAPSEEVPETPSRNTKL